MNPTMRYLNLINHILTFHFKISVNVWQLREFSHARFSPANNSFVVPLYESGGNEQIRSHYLTSCPVTFVISSGSYSLLRSVPVRNIIQIQVRFWTFTEVRREIMPSQWPRDLREIKDERHKTLLEMHFQRDGAPHISVGKRRST